VRNSPENGWSPPKLSASATKRSSRSASPRASAGTALQRYDERHMDSSGRAPIIDEKRGLQGGLEWKNITHAGHLSQVALVAMSLVPGVGGGQRQPRAGR
jgi:hypothetical protein